MHLVCRERAGLSTGPTLLHPQSSTLLITICEMREVALTEVELACPGPLLGTASLSGGGPPPTNQQPGEESKAGALTPRSHQRPGAPHLSAQLLSVCGPHPVTCHCVGVRGGTHTWPSSWDRNREQGKCREKKTKGQGVRPSEALLGSLVAWSACVPLARVWPLNTRNLSSGGKCSCVSGRSARLHSTGIP